MSYDVVTTRAREVMAEQLIGLTFLFAISRGNPAWDTQWDDVNPPTPPLSALGVLDLIGYVRPILQGYVTPDADGMIGGENGERFAVSPTRTRYPRVRLSIPAGAFPNQTIREVGLFSSPVIDSSVLPGQTIIDPSDVSDPGDLNRIVWTRPQFLSPGTSYARNLILRV